MHTQACRCSEAEAEKCDARRPHDARRPAAGDGTSSPFSTIGRCNGRPMRHKRRSKNTGPAKVLPRSCVVVRRQVLEHPLHVCAEGVCFVSRPESPTISWQPMLQRHNDAALWPSQRRISPQPQLSVTMRSQRQAGSMAAARAHRTMNLRFYGVLNTIGTGIMCGTVSGSGRTDMGSPGPCGW